MVAANPPLPVIRPRFSVGDVMLWGKLVKMWATGKEYPGVPVMPQPRSLAELQEQCDTIKLTINIPSDITGMVVVNYTREALLIRIPEKSLVEDSERFLSDPRTDYPDLPIYKLLDQFEGPDKKIKKEHKLDFHAARIGDYSIAHCS
jgi:hypothetical protein